MPARADGHAQTALPREPYAGRHVPLILGQHYGGREPLRPPDVEDPPDPRLLVAGLAAPDDVHEITDWPPSTTMSTALRYAASSEARNSATRATSWG